MQRIAWIDEDGDDGEDAERFRPRALGVFSASVQGDDLPDGSRPGPTGASVEDALEWARRQADCVIVRYQAPVGQPGTFSAGAREPDWGDEPPLPRWPPRDLDLSVRREPGWEELDRSPSDPPISWDITGTVGQLRGPALARFAETYAGFLRGAGVDGLDWIDVAAGGPLGTEAAEGARLVGYDAGGGEAIRFLFRLSAPTQELAHTAAEPICTSALARTLSALQIDGPPDDWPIEVFAFASGSEAARWNAGIRDDEEEEEDEE